MGNPIVSVIMPVFNGERFLVEAIESILDQTFTDLELIIINDGSSDASFSIANKYKALDSRIVLISQENIGLIKSLNKGISLSRGKYIARMDADDISLPTRIERQVCALEKEDADICGCHFYAIDINGKKISTTLVPLNVDSILLNMCLTVPFAHGSVVIRKSFIDEQGLRYGLRNAKTAEDYDLWVQFFDKNARFCNVDDFLFEYREYPTSLSKLNNKNLKSDAKKLSKYMIAEYQIQVKRSIINSIDISLSDDEEKYLIASSLYLFRYHMDFTFIKVLRKVSLKSSVNMLLKFFSGRFF